MSDTLIAEDPESSGPPARMLNIAAIDDSKLVPRIMQLAEDRDLYFDSLLDVGCGLRPLNRWFARYARSEAPRRYIGLDKDDTAVQSLKAQGVLGLPSFNADFPLASDLVIAADVLEYLNPSSTAPFLKKCASLTCKMFALSTPNARHWTRRGMKKEHGWVKWLPDSAIQCFAESESARIRNLTDADQIAALMLEAFDAEKFDIAVYEAWPWEIRDLAGGESECFHLKTFAVAIAKDGIS
jgi:hypothetical protein